MDKSEEKSILKAISILGGTQVCNIAVGIVRNKAVSVLIGAAGMGCMALYHSTSDVITTISNMGISTTAVRNISKAYTLNDLDSLSFVVHAFRKIVLLTGAIATFICMLSSPLLSFINFGDYNHISHFILFSFSLFGLQMVAGYTTLLQGCRQFSRMSKATLLGNIVGLVICIPLYVFWGMSAIVPVFVIYPIINYCILKKVTQSIYVKEMKVTFKEAYNYGREMINTGLFISLQTLFSMMYIYILRLYLSNQGGMEIVGFFSAGMLMVNQYVGLVFSSMGTEYYPRLSSVNGNKLFISTINDQITRTIIILAPLISMMILFMPIVIRILYTEDFLIIVTFSILMLASVGFRVVEWCIGMSFIAKGKTRVLFLNEISFKLYLFAMSVILYHYCGISGIGIAYLLSEIVFSLQSLIVSNKTYGYTPSHECIKTFLPLSILILLTMGSCLWLTRMISICLSIIAICIEFAYVTNYYKRIKS